MMLATRTPTASTSKVSDPSYYHPLQFPKLEHIAFVDSLDIGESVPKPVSWMGYIRQILPSKPSPPSHAKDVSRLVHNRFCTGCGIFGAARAETSRQETNPKQYI